MYLYNSSRPELLQFSGISTDHQMQPVPLPGSSTSQAFPPLPLGDSAFSQHSNLNFSPHVFSLAVFHGYAISTDAMIFGRPFQLIVTFKYTLIITVDTSGHELSGGVVHAIPLTCCLVRRLV